VVRLTREYAFRGDRYDFEVRIQASNGSKEPVAVRPGLELVASLPGELAGDSYSFYGVVVDTKGSINRYDLKGRLQGKVEKSSAMGWRRTRSTSLDRLSRAGLDGGRAALLGETGVVVAVADTAATLQPGDMVRSSTRVFAGPKRQDLLESLGRTCRS